MAISITLVFEWPLFCRKKSPFKYRIAAKHVSLLEVTPSALNHNASAHYMTSTAARRVSLLEPFLPRACTARATTNTEQANASAIAL